MMHNTSLMNEAKAWIKRERGPNEVVKIIGNTAASGIVSYELFTAYSENPDYFGRILFDTEGFWIYDGDVLTIAEQEQVAKFIINFGESSKHVEDDGLKFF
ncbi:hypothetical protein [Daejeonella lutea]|uniref:Uncharacterized protein n=1 Tax=Daejeonella lutea TaxID=572036 RepID=A0A1T5AB01_9SPHI|nr:hypothetical protein [Daejeonella lutea]SKB32085.1 hypothetical protein SAMN05661099_0532 [Daejeonella lutea]